ncbi:MAG: site-specific integrase [Planctomycetota bacterium]|jgi:site-specific recombinase XerD
MLAELFPLDHTRFASLPVLGPCLEGFVTWLRTGGYARPQVRRRLLAAEGLAARLRRDGVRGPGDLTAAGLLEYAPADSQEDIYLAAAVHSLVRYFNETGVFSSPPATRSEALVASYRAYLDRVRGLSARTLVYHTATVTEFVAFLRHDRDPDRLCDLASAQIEAFLQLLGGRLSRASLQHTVAHLRSFLRFLAARGLVPPGLHARIDTPRVYRRERLPRALPWETVLALLRAIDRSTSMGRRDYAMLLLVATYGLRSREVVTLTLDDVDWRAGRLCVRRPKVRAPLVLPLTPGVGAALLAYLRHGRPTLPHREIFLRMRGPAVTLKPTALTEVFQGWARRSGLPIPFQGAHCLRHSLALHLLRQGTPLKTIGDLLGHRRADSTCAYLQLHIEDLRDVALDLPAEGGEEVHR